MQEIHGSGGRAFEATHFHVYCGIGGGAKGFNAADVRANGLSLRYRCLGGIDSNPDAVADFGKLAGVPGTLLDLFSEDQYVRFHGHEPPKGWREATSADVLAASRNETADVTFLSPPCKGLSGLMSDTKAATEKYRALNDLTVRGIWLTLEACASTGVLPRLLVLENVPRIMTRGRPLLDQIGTLLRSYDYAVAETVHDCGIIGGLSQSRKRFLMVARHRPTVPACLYTPPKQRLRSVGDAIGSMPMPGHPEAGPMHRVPRLTWKTWVRLAFIQAGSDWRSLSGLRACDGELAGYGIVPEGGHRGGFLGVTRWDQHSGVVTGRSLPNNGNFSVADPRLPDAAAGGDGPGCAYAYRIVRRGPDTPALERSGAIAGQGSPLGEGLPVSDPRPTLTNQGRGKYGVARWDRHSRTVISESGTGQGAYAVADPRLASWQERRTGQETATALPLADQRVLAVIRSEDGTWHRPFTTAELAVLQSLATPEETLLLSGNSDSSMRERTGNAVPPAAAQAIATEMGRTLLLAHAGETFKLSDVPIWVRNVAIGLAVDADGQLGHSRMP